MSEYQYYEFVAVDRPLTAEQVSELRTLSTRADITSTRFVNEYQWGGFKGDPAVLMERYFDAFLYTSNWGTNQLVFRLPAAALDPGTAQLYCDGEIAAVRAAGDHVILELTSEGEELLDEEYTGPFTLSSIITARAELMAGDHRLLYLAWLLGIQWALEEDGWDEWGDEVEPPVPAGLDSLSGALHSVVELLRVDADLLAVAAEGDGSSRRLVRHLLASAAARR